MVMKKVEGVTWHALLADPEHPRWRKLLREGWDRADVHLDVLRQVCCALEFAHDARVIHRDVKPENVMLGAFGEVYLLDWGVAARLDDAGVARDAGDVVGTPGFMSPEQVSASAGPQGPWTDVYLLGATLHVVLTGRYRHEGDTLLACLHASLVSEPVTYPDAVPSDLAALCQRATRPRADERPPSVAAFRAALEECVAHRGSMSLCRAASASLAALRAALTPGDGAAPDREAAVRASAACRFGYAQALAAWPRNDDARRGLQSCLDMLFEDELSRQGVEAAEALAAEMPARTADHDARLEALRARRADDAARVETMRSVAYEMDASVSKTQRSQTFFAWGALVVAFNALTLARLWLGGAPTHRELVAMAAAGVAAAGVAAWRERASLLRNTYNRAMTTMLGGLVFAPLAHRLAAASAGVSTAWVVTVDQLVLCLMMGLGGAVLAPWMLGGAGVLGLGAAVSVALPSAAYASFAVSTSAAVVVTVALALREGVVSADPSR